MPDIADGYVTFAAQQWEHCGSFTGDGAQWGDTCDSSNQSPCKRPQLLVTSALWHC